MNNSELPALIKAISHQKVKAYSSVVAEAIGYHMISKERVVPHHKFLTALYLYILTEECLDIQQKWELNQLLNIAITQIRSPLNVVFEGRQLELLDELQDTGQVNVTWIYTILKYLAKPAKEQDPQVIYYLLPLIVYLCPKTIDINNDVLDTCLLMFYRDVAVNYTTDEMDIDKLNLRQIMAGIYAKLTKKHRNKRRFWLDNVVAELHWVAEFLMWTLIKRNNVDSSIHDDVFKILAQYRADIITSLGKDHL